MIYQIYLPDEKQATAVFTYLESVGVSISETVQGGTTAAEKAKEYAKNYPWVVIRKDEKYVGGNYGPDKRYKTLDFNELFNLFAEIKVEVKLNDNHSAIVNKNGIVVGCQTFPLSIIDELVKARDIINQ